MCLRVPLGFVSYVNVFFHTFWRDCDETYDTTVKQLESSKVFFLHALQVDDVDCVVTQFQKLVSSEFGIRIRVARIDECEIDSMSSCLNPAGTRPLSLMAFSIFATPMW